MLPDRPVVAVFGKGGVGKTVVSALASRAIVEAGVASPVLIVDADPLMGLASAMGMVPTLTLGQIRDRVVDTLRREDDGKKQVASSLDYWLLEAMSDGDAYALLVMGRSRHGDKGCYCPVNSLLRSAIDLVIESFASVLIDAEAGVEQIRREVTRRVNLAIVVVDGSSRAFGTAVVLREMLPDSTKVVAVANRLRADEPEPELPPGIELVAKIPEDDELRAFDRRGRSLWELPEGNAAARSVKPLVELFQRRGVA